MAKIIDISAAEILDSRGNPTVSATVTLEGGVVASASVPSGASTGAHEALELRDGDQARYRGLGVRKAVANVNTEIRAALLGMDAADQAALDRTLLELDGTENKNRLGANAILGVSLAACRAAALERGMPLYAHIAELTGVDPRASFPLPMFNIINGGKHSNSGLSVQEFKIVPAGIEGYPEQLRAGSEIFHALEKLIDAAGFSTGVGDEGGFAPRLDSHVRQMDMIRDAVEQAGYAYGQEVFLDLDVAADSFYDAEEEIYALKPENVSLSRDALVSLYREWVGRYALVSVEDGLHEEDWLGWNQMREKLEAEPAAWGKPVMLVGDDLLVTNPKRLAKAIEQHACNAVLIKVNQIGTLTETLECMRLAREAGMKRVVSHRSGETEDDFIADLAVGAGAEFIKTGSLSRGERMSKYNRLLGIWRAFHQA